MENLGSVLACCRYWVPGIGRREKMASRQGDLGEGGGEGQKRGDVVQPLVGQRTVSAGYIA